MYYLIIHLYQERYWNDVLLALAAEGITDALVLDATHIERALALEVPLFAGFWANMDRKSRFVKLILAPTADRAVVSRIVGTLKEEGVDLTDPAVGRLLLLPAEEL